MAEIMVDVDDVIVPWAEVVRDAAVEMNLIDPGTSWTDWSQWESWNITREEWSEAVMYSIALGLYTKAQPYPGAIEALNRLAWEGHNIHIVTARAPMLRSETEMLFRDHGIAHKTLTFTNHKVLAQEELGIEFDYAVDDGAHNFENLFAAGVDVYLMDQPHNQHVITTRRVRSLTEFGHRIMKEETARGRAA